MASSVTIKSVDDYVNKGYAENTISNVVVAARDPGSWANGIKLAILDGRADQIITGIDTTAVLGFSSTANGGLAAVAGYELGVADLDLSVGLGVTQAIPAGTVVAGAGSTSLLDGYLKGVITELGNGQVSVKVVSHVSAAGTETAVDYTPGGVYEFRTVATSAFMFNLPSVETGRYGWTSSTVSYGSSFTQTAFLTALTGAGITAGDARYVAAQAYMAMSITLAQLIGSITKQSL